MSSLHIHVNVVLVDVNMDWTYIQILGLTNRMITNTHIEIIILYIITCIYKTEGDVIYCVHRVGLKKVKMLWYKPGLKLLMKPVLMLRHPEKN